MPALGPIEQNEPLRTVPKAVEAKPVENPEVLAQDAEAALLAGEGAEALGVMSSRIEDGLFGLRGRLGALDTRRRGRAKEEVLLVRRERRLLRSQISRLARLGGRIRNESLEIKLYETCAAKLGSMGRVRALDGLVLLLIFVVIGMLIVEYTGDMTPEREQWFAWVDTAICAVFLGEFFFKLACSAYKGWYFRRHWIDFVASIPFAGMVSLGRTLRLARLARLARVVRVVRAVVFLQSRIARSVRKNRAVLDQDYELSFDSVRRYLEGLSDRRADQADAQGKMLAWLVREVENSLLLRIVRGLTFGLLRRRIAGPAEGDAPRPRTSGVGKRLADVVGSVQAAICYLYDFNGTVTTPQLFNYVGQAMFRAGKRRGIVLFAVGVFGALLGYLVKQAFGPIITAPRPSKIDVGMAAKQVDLNFGKALCGRGASKMKVFLENSGLKLSRPVQIVDVSLENGGVFRLEKLSGLPRQIMPGRAMRFDLVFQPVSPGQYRDALVVLTREGERIRRSTLGLGIDSWAHRFAFRSSQSFGINFVLISLPFLGIALLGWVWVRKSKQVTEDYKNVAEASFLNLMEDAKKLTMFGDLCWLYDEVLHREAVLDYGQDAVEQQQRAIRQKIEAIVQEGRTTDPGYAIEEMAYDRSMFPTDGKPGRLTAQELAMTREGFVLEAIHIISRGSPVASLHNVHAAAALQLYRDYLDGALFHETDRKTIEQLLGNITIRRVLKLIEFTGRDLKRLHRLTAPFGPNLWLTFICRSIAEQTGRLVSEFNSSCAPVRDLGPDDIRGDRELREQYEQWLQGGPPIRGDDYLTHDFNAMHFLVDDARQDARVREMYGDRVLAKLRRDRCRMIRTVFGTYPWRQSAKVNPYRLYRLVFGRDPLTEIRMGRLRRALGLPKGAFRIAALPFRVMLWMLKGVMWATRWSKQFVLNILADVETEQERPDFEAALRKIIRMRGPVIAETVAIRGRFDFAYAGCASPDQDATVEQSRCLADLKSVNASEVALASFEELRERWATRLSELRDFLDAEAPGQLDGEALRAVQTAYMVNAGGIRTWIRACGPHIETAEQEIAKQGYRWPRGRWTKPLLHAWHWAVTFGHDRATRTFDAFCGLTETRTGQPRRRLFMAYLLNAEGLTDAIDAFVASNGRPHEKALAVIEDIEKGGYEEWTAELITVRTVHMLSLLDRRNYEAAVYRLGRFDEVGAVLPERGGRIECRVG